MHQLVAVEAEGEQHGLFQPLVRHPLAVDLVGDAEAAAIEQVERALDGFAILAVVSRIERVAHLPGGFDIILEGGEVGHGRALISRRFSSPVP